MARPEGTAEGRVAGGLSSLLLPLASSSGVAQDPPGAAQARVPPLSGRLLGQPPPLPARRLGQGPLSHCLWDPCPQISTLFLEPLGLRKGLRDWLGSELPALHRREFCCFHNKNPRSQNPWDGHLASTQCSTRLFQVE